MAADNKRTVQAPKGTKRKARAKSPSEDEGQMSPPPANDPGFEATDRSEDLSLEPTLGSSDLEEVDREFREPSPRAPEREASAPSVEARESGSPPPARTESRREGSARDSREPRDPRDRDRDRDARESREPRENRDNRETRDSREPREPREASPARFKPIDEYSAVAYYDKTSRNFIGSFLEFPELRVTGANKENVLRELDTKLENHLQTIKRRGETIPEPFSARKYPERLDVRISPALYRRLDILSRLEKVGLDQLVTELLSASVEKHAPAPRAPQRQQQQHSHQNSQESRGNQQPRHQHHRRGGGNRNYHDTMDNRENFMEYVRSLEKGGGNWRKK